MTVVGVGLEIKPPTNVLPESNRHGVNEQRPALLNVGLIALNFSGNANAVSLVFLRVFSHGLCLLVRRAAPGYTGEV